MTETEKQREASPDAAAECASRCHGKKGWLCLLAVVLIFAAGVAFAHCPWVMRLHAPIKDTRLSAQQAEIEALTQRVETLEKRVDNVAAVPAVTDSNAQAGVQALAARVDQLQKDMQETHTLASQSREAAQGQIAGALAVMELKSAVDAGRGFVRELDLLQTLAKDDVAIQSDIAKLQSSAAEGVPTCAMLLDKLRVLEISAAPAGDAPSGNADVWQNIWQKIKAEIQKFVTIRPLHQSSEAIYGALEHALTRGDVAAAMSAYHSLPDSAAASLRDWSQQLTRRYDANEVVRDMMAHATLTTSGGTP